MRSSQAFAVIALAGLLSAPCLAAGTYRPHHAALPFTLAHSVNWAMYAARIPQPKPRAAAALRGKRRFRPLSRRTQSAWTTFQYSNLRTGWNPHETALNTGNVNPSSFGMLYSEPVDGEVYAEPLYVPRVAIGKRNVHDLLLVATEGDSIYALDAETGTQLWKTTYVNPPAVTTFDPSVCGCSNIAFQQGITGTPVVDLHALMMYFVTKTVEMSGSQATTHYRLHKVDIRTGLDVAPNTDINASVQAVDGTEVFLDQVWSIQRPGVVLNGNVVYVAFGSASDYHPLTTSAWVIAFDKNSLAQIAQYSDETGYPQEQYIWYGGQTETRLGTVWMAGGAPAVDGQGSLYVQTGNGAYDGGSDFAMSVVKLAPDLSSVEDSFTPTTWWNDSNSDLDLGSAGVILLPRQSGQYHNVAIGGGKTGLTYVMNRNHMGGFNPSNDQILSETETNDGLWGTPAAYTGPDGKTYVLEPGGGPMTLWQVQTGSGVNLGYMNQTPDRFGDYDDSGSEPVVSSNGTTSGSAIVWVYSRVGSGGPAQLNLRGYDASNLANELVNVPFTNWLGGGELLSPSVANGMVFTAGEGVVSAFGLL